MPDLFDPGKDYIKFHTYYPKSRPVVRATFAILFILLIHATYRAIDHFYPHLFHQLGILAAHLLKRLTKD